MSDRLFRSRSDRVLAGVAGGLADHFDLDPSLVRVGWAILILLSGGIFLVIYIVMAIVVPEEPIGSGSAGWSPTGPAGWSAGSAGWSTSWPAAGAPAAGDPAAGDPAAGAQAADPALSPPAAAGSADAGPLAHEPAGPSETPGSSAPGFAAPVGGSWSPPGPTWQTDSRSTRRAARDARRAARQAARGGASDRPGSGGIIAGLILVALGLYFLARTFLPDLQVDRFWPAGLVVLGLVLVVLSIRRTPDDSTP